MKATLDRGLSSEVVDKRILHRRPAERHARQGRPALIGNSARLRSPDLGRISLRSGDLPVRVAVPLVTSPAKTACEHRAFSRPALLRDPSAQEVAAADPAAIATCRVPRLSTTATGGSARMETLGTTISSLSLPSSFCARKASFSDERSERRRCRAPRMWYRGARPETDAIALALSP